MSGKGKWYEWPLGKDKGDEGGIQRISTLSPEQQAVISKLGPFLEERIGKGLPAWSGDWVAPASEYETSALGKLGEYLQGGVSPLYTQGSNVLSELIKSGSTPEDAVAWYQKYMAPENKRIFTQETLPGINEAHVGPGTFWGTPRAEAQRKAWETFGTQEMARTGEAIRQQQAMAAGLLPLEKEYAQYGEEYPLRKAQAGLQYGQLPRLLQQADLAAKFEEFKRTTPELSPIIDKALQLLNVSTTAAYYQEPTESPFIQILKAVAPGVGSYLGTKAG